MPNTLAYIVLFSWPIVVIVLFRMLPVAAALAWSIIGGYLLLPGQTGINLPMVPVIDKDGVPSMAAAVMCLIVAGGAAEAARRRQRADAGQAALGAPRSMQPPKAIAETALFGRTFGSMVLQGLVLLACASIFLTVITNARPVVFGPKIIPGLRLYDAVSVLANLMIALLPFFLGRRYLATPESHVTLLRIFCIAGLGYSLLSLYEVRMSPQLNRMVYGFFPGSFQQQMRGGGFRPLVFLHHGLWLGIFTAMTVLSAAALWRHSMAEGKSKADAAGAGDSKTTGGKTNGATWLWAGAVLWLLVTLVLSHSIGALAIGILLLPVVLLFGVRGQLLLATIVACTVLFYPMLRGTGLIPVDTVVSWAKSINEERAASLEFRLVNEDALLLRADEKPLAGWGSWGRNRIYSEDTGGKVTTTDGMWIITIGSWGWLGYISQFGLLTLPIFFLAYSRRKLDLSFATSGLALMLAANLMDMIPNATLTPLTWLVGGALVGRVAVAAATQAQPRGFVRRERPSQLAQARTADTPPQNAPQNRPPPRQPRRQLT